MLQSRLLGIMNLLTRLLCFFFSVQKICWVDVKGRSNLAPSSEWGWGSSQRVMCGFPGGASGKKKPSCQCRRRQRLGFNLWVRKISWNGKWQPTPVFLPRKFHGQSALVGYSPWGHKESDMTEQLSTQTIFLHKKEREWSRSVVSDSLRPHGL